MYVCFLYLHVLKKVICFVSYLHWVLELLLGFPMGGLCSKNMKSHGQSILRTTILPQFTTVDKIIQTFSFLGKLIVTTINTTMQEGNVTTWTTIKIRLVAIAIL